jgi:methyl-accepting chemotaxis protein
MAVNEEQAIRDFAKRGTWLCLKWGVPTSGITAFLVGTALGLSNRNGLVVTAIVLPPIILMLGTLYPYLCFRFLAGRALRHRPADVPGARLGRLLELPWRGITFTMIPIWLVGGFLFSLAIVSWFKLDQFHLLVGTLIPGCFGVVLTAPVGLSLEKLVLPWALEEQHEQPSVSLQGGLFRPRQSWFLPFTYVVSILALLVMSLCVVAAKLYRLEATLRQELSAEARRFAGEVQTVVHDSLVRELGLELAGVCLLLLVLPTLTYWLLARRQAYSAEAVGKAIEGLASGQVVSPEWVSTDEIGDLASGMNAVLARLRRLPQRLQDSATRLLSASNELSAANLEQQEGLTQQAAAIQEAQVTAQEIKQTSLMAADRAEEVLKVTGRSETLGRQGEAAIEQSMAGLTSIQEVVVNIMEQLQKLQQRTSQIGGITETVKTLSDRSNILALNAAIEAVRSGEHGKGFSVVAREIRTLANQSSDAAGRITLILDEVTSAIRDAADIGEKGFQQLEGGLTQMRTSSQSLRELSQLAQHNSATVRQIAASVTQQNTGITQVFKAIDQLAKNMGDTLDRLTATQEAASTLKVVSQEVDQLARQFDTSQAGPR